VERVAVGRTFHHNTSLLLMRNGPGMPRHQPGVSTEVLIPMFGNSTKVGQPHPIPVSHDGALDF